MTTDTPRDTGHPLPPVFQPLLPEDPSEVGGYRLFARLGAGGMGRVYLSYTPGGRPVALKVVRPEFAEDAEFRRRFAQEVTNAQRIHGLYTAQVIDSGTDAEAPWLVTAYVPGPSLQQVVREHGALPVRTVLLLMGGIAEALQAIHSVEVVHRDLKPANVLVAGDGPRVIDFGIARAADATALTGTGFRIGSPAFMAPEQAQGRPVTPATDVFALGALAAYVAGGAPPFGEGPETAVLYRVVHEQPDLERVPDDLRELLLRCLAKQPEDRPTPAEIIETARNHPAVGGQLRFADDWLPTQVNTEITRRSDLPRTPPTPLPVPPLTPPQPTAPPVAGPTPPVGSFGAPPVGSFGAPPLGSFGAPQPPTEAPTAPVLGPPPTAQLRQEPSYDTPAPAPVPAELRPQRKGVSWRTLLTVALAMALAGTVGGVVLVNQLGKDDKGANSGAVAGGTSSGNPSDRARPSEEDSPAQDAASPSPSESESEAATDAPSGTAAPAKYTAVYTGTELSSPDNSYDFDIKAGKVIPQDTGKWYLGHGSNDFQIPSESDAYIAHGGRLTPAECSAAIDLQPVKELKFDDLPPGRAFCVRSRNTHDIAIVRVIAVTNNNGPVRISMDYYRNDG